MADVILTLDAIPFATQHGPPVYGVLFGGIFIAVIGMALYLRWTAYQDEKKREREKEQRKP